MPSSRARTSSAHTPAALTTGPGPHLDADAGLAVLDHAAGHPAGAVVRQLDHGAWLTHTAPWDSAAVRATVRVRRASSAWAS